MAERSFVEEVKKLRLGAGRERTGLERGGMSVPNSGFGDTGTEILSAAVNGKRLTANTSASEPQKDWSLYYFALPKEGIELAVETKSAAPLAVRVVDESYGLPLIGGGTFRNNVASIFFTAKHWDERTVPIQALVGEFFGRTAGFKEGFPIAFNAPPIFALGITSYLGARVLSGSRQ